MRVQKGEFMYTFVYIILGLAALQVVVGRDLIISNLWAYYLFHHSQSNTHSLL